MIRDLKMSQIKGDGLRNHQETSKDRSNSHNKVYLIWTFGAWTRLFWVKTFCLGKCNSNKYVLLINFAYFTNTHSKLPFQFCNQGWVNFTENFYASINIYFVIHLRKYVQFAFVLLLWNEWDFSIIKSHKHFKEKF